MQARTLPEFGMRILVLVALAAVGCGPSRGSASFDVTPEAPSVLVGERLTLEAQASEDPGGDIEWEVVETYGGGLLQTKGTRVTYVAPPSAGTFHLRLRAARPGSGTLRQEVPILVLPSLRLEPSNTALAPGSSVTFLVRQKGLPRGTFAWSVDEPEGGSIGPDGTYRAPALRGTYHVTATSTEDRNASVSTTVTVQ